MKQTFFSVLFAIDILFGWPIEASFHHGNQPPTEFVSPLKIGAGGWLVGVDVNVDGTRLARTDTYGAYIWSASDTSCGVTGCWSQLNTTSRFPAQYSGYYPRTGASQVSQNGGGVYEITSAASNSSVIYLMWFGYIFKSTDHGATFTRTGTTFGGSGTISTIHMASNGTQRMNGRRMAVDPINTNIVWAGTDSAGIFLSQDGGTTWSNQAPSLLPTQTCVDSPTNNNCANYNIAFDPTSATVTCPTVGGSCTGTLFIFAGGSVRVSTDAGATWNATTSGPSLVQHMVVAPHGGDVWAVDGSVSGTVWRYRSGAWTNFTGAGTAGSGVHSIAVDPDPAKVDGNGRSNHIVAGNTGGSVSVSPDGGTTWGAATTNVRAATDVPWLANANEGFMSNGNMAFDPSLTNTLVFGEGIGVWVANPPTTAVGGNMTWTSNSAGIEQLVSRDVMAPNGVAVTGVSDRGTYRLGSPDTYPATQNTTYNNNSFSLNVAWGVDYAAGNTNFMATVTGDINSTSNNNSGYSTDGGANWQQFNSYRQTFAATSITSGTGGVIKITVPSTTGLTAWSATGNSPNGSSGSIVRIIAFNGASGSSNIVRYWPIQNVTSTTFELIGSVFTGCVCNTGSGSYEAYVDTSPFTTNANGYQITGMVNDGGKIRVEVVTNASSSITNSIACISGVLGIPEANGCWQVLSTTQSAITSGGSGSITLANSTWNSNTWTPGSGVVKKVMPPGGAIAVASQNVIMISGANQDYPQCSTDGGQTWTEMHDVAGTLPGPRTITAASWSGSVATFTLSSAIPGLVTGNGFRVWGMTPTGYNGNLTAIAGTSGTTVKATMAVDPGTSTGFGSMAPSSNGWINASFLNAHQYAADRTTTDTIYLYNINSGTYVSVNCAAPTRQSSTLIANTGFNTTMKSVAGYAGHLFIAPGPQGSEPGVAHPSTSAGLRRSTDGGATWGAAIVNLREARSVGLGAIAPGSDYPTVYVVGWVDISDGNGYIYGIWRTTGTAAQWAAGSGTGTGLTWVKAADYPNGWFDTNGGALTGDGVTWNQWYSGYGGSGYHYGKQNFLLKRDLDPASNDNDPMWLEKAA